MYSENAKKLVMLHVLKAVSRQCKPVHAGFDLYEVQIGKETVTLGEDDVLIMKELIRDRWAY